MDIEFKKEKPLSEAYLSGELNPEKEKELRDMLSDPNIPSYVYIPVDRFLTDQK